MPRSLRRRDESFFVYIMTNRSGTLYVGMTNSADRRAQEHKEGAMEGFTKRYKINRLVYYEEFDDPISAIEREKEIKGWVRRKKIELIRQMNPRWEDLAGEVRWER
jgi:putative endonuclease